MQKNKNFEKWTEKFLKDLKDLEEGDDRCREYLYDSLALRYRLAREAEARHKDEPATSVHRDLLKFYYLLEIAMGGRFNEYPSKGD